MIDALLMTLSLIQPALGLAAEAPAPVKTMTVFDFSSPQAAQLWRAVNDDVMGGVSRSALWQQGETALFAGEVSLENNGGFASIRGQVPTGALAGADGLVVKVRGDGKRYKLLARMAGRYDAIAYRVPFETVAGEWMTLSVPFEVFEPSFRGRVVDGAPRLDAGAIRSLGLLIADEQDGPFRLEIATIGVYGIASRSEDVARLELSP